jgi:tRNA(Ile2) C34 agmatinyltransferase TiaS
VTVITIAVAVVVAALIAGLALAISSARVLRRQLVCPSCGCDLRGHGPQAARCPECSAPVSGAHDVRNIRGTGSRCCVSP